MSDDELPHQPDVALLSCKLNESLKACQAIVANYRLMFAGGANDNQPADTRSDSRITVETTGAEEA